jgi:hypothetical protein
VPDGKIGVSRARGTLFKVVFFIVWQVVMEVIAVNHTTAFLLNYPEIPDSCYPCLDSA